MSEVILKINELKAQTNYAQSSISAQPIGDLLLAIEVSDNEIKTQPDGSRTFTKDGIRGIIKGLYTSLILDAERSDF